MACCFCGALRLDASPSSSCVHSAQNRGRAGVSWSSVYTHHVDRIYKPGLLHNSGLPSCTTTVIFLILNYYFITSMVVFEDPCSCVSRFGLAHSNFMFCITPCKAMWHSTSLSAPGFHGRLMCSSPNEAFLDILWHSSFFFCQGLYDNTVPFTLRTLPHPWVHSCTTLDVAGAFLQLGYCSGQLRSQLR